MSNIGKISKEYGDSGDFEPRDENLAVVYAADASSRLGRTVELREYL